MYATYEIRSGDLLLFFFFKQKTAYEMRISDWSSDVCSSDLVTPWVLRPTCEISEARVRTSVPPSEINSTSWLSESWIAPTSLPLRAVVCSAITPLVPRPLRG